MNEVNRVDRPQHLDDLPSGQRFVLCRNGKKYTSLRRAESGGFIPARCDAGRYALLAAEWEVKPILKTKPP